MLTFLKMSFRNIFRHKRRSVIVILTIATGLWGMIVSKAYYDGMINQIIKTVIEMDSGHLQIHRTGFQEKMLINLLIPETEKVEKEILKRPEIKAFSPRIRGNGLAQTAEYSSGVMILGIVPKKEQNITSVKKNVIQGAYLDEINANGILIGKAFAELFKLDLGGKLILMVQDNKNEIGSAAFRVCGFFRSASPEFDKGAVFINLESAEKLFSLGQNISEYTLILKDQNQLEKTKQILQKDLGERGAH